MNAKCAYNMKKLAFFIIISQLLLSPVTYANGSFVVHDIQVRGVNRLTSATVLNYLPVKRGSKLTSAESASAIRALYQTGMFEQVSLSHEGNVLIVHVVERPTIGRLTITGNSVVPTDKLTTVLRSLDVAEGRLYNASVLEKIKQSLLSQYYQLGRYNARVDIQAAPLPHHRVQVTIAISEGLVAQVRGISIIGNKAFSDRILIKQMDLTTPGIYTIISQTDRFSQEKLDSSVEKIRNYYMDRGYLKFAVVSAQAQVTPDRKAVYINIVVAEGQKYNIASVEVIGDFVLTREETMKLITVKSGQTFSRQAVLDSQKLISRAYGNKGYLYATVAVQPDLNETNHTIALLFNVKSGKKTYVRQVTFSDHNRTNEIVLRREVQQLEASPVSTVKLDESKQRLQLLPYLKQIDMSINPVEGTDDQVDVNYKVKEDSATQASLKFGYSQTAGLVTSAAFNQKNFFGTGNTFGMNLSRSSYQQAFAMDFTNPYYTESGISRSWNFSVSRVDPDAVKGLTSAYTTNELNFGIMFGIPIGYERGAYTRLFTGLSYQNLNLHLSDNPLNIPTQISTFVNNHGRHFQEADFKIGITRDSRDRAIFPTRGSQNTLYLDAYAPLGQGSLGFYMLNYAGRAYQPIYGPFILMERASLGYGNGYKGLSNFPFYKNYYSGGIDTVRGYEAYSLGPRDSLGNSYGANMQVNASIALIFPNYISDSLRTSVFVDGGNVYTSRDNREFGGLSTNSGSLRYAVGIEADWLTPFGPIELSLAKPLNPYTSENPFLNSRQNKALSDRTEIFQFSLGANF